MKEKANVIVRGRAHYKSTVSDLEVEAIRNAHEEGMSYQALSKKYGLSKSGIAGIVTMRRRREPSQHPRKNRKPAVSKVRLSLSVTPAARAFFHRLGGASFVEKLHSAYLDCVDEKGVDPERLLQKIVQPLKC